jgi:intracellular multiplication protein IcmC
MNDTSNMLAALMQSVPGIMGLLNAICSLSAICLTGMAVLRFIEIGRFGDQPGGVKLINPILYLLSAVAMWNFSGSVDTVLQTVYGSSARGNNLMAYTNVGGYSEKTQLMLKNMIVVLRLFGYITFFRGWITIKKIGDGKSASDEPFKKAMVRIIAGVLLINIVATVNIFATTFGFGDVF